MDAAMLGSPGPVHVLWMWPGMMLVYEVVAGDMLVGKPGFKGLLCQYLGDRPHFHWACSRPIVTGLVTLLILLPLVSFRCCHAMQAVSTTVVLPKQF